ncbi:QueT transporter family protein [Companilactobacillus metriopterae]|uniref:QueT transporter family protein n=1 Tax=Companilactobacillus metriopterae TaxID=1909267 RepID=UPI00100B33BC|nr:QueT transporter family protein [Companilactobacillus metriopterae]
MKRSTENNIISVGIVAALYVAVTLAIAPFSYGAIQLRISELFNHLAAFNKKYIFAITLGCFIANIFSPLGLIDMIFGTIASLICTTLTWLFAKNIKNKYYKYIIATFCQLPGTFIVALELNIYMKLPLLLTWLTVTIGEFISMFIGAIIVDLVSRKINFSEGKIIK